MFQLEGSVTEVYMTGSSIIQPHLNLLNSSELETN